MSNTQAEPKVRPKTAKPQQGGNGQGAGVKRPPPAATSPQATARSRTEKADSEVERSSSPDSERGSGPSALLNLYLDKQGYTPLDEADQRGKTLRSPLTLYVNSHLEELRDQAGDLVGVVCVVPQAVVRGLSNYRQGVRQALRTVAARRYGKDRAPVKENEISVQRVKKRDPSGNDALAYAVSAPLKPQ